MHHPRAPDALRDRVVYCSDVAVRDTRGSLAGLLQPVRRELARRFYNFRAASEWNRTPANVRQATTARACRVKRAHG